MYEAQTSQFLIKTSGVSTYPPNSTIDGYTFKINEDNTVDVISSIPLGKLSAEIKRQFTTKQFLVADTGDGSTEIRRITKFDEASRVAGKLTLDKAFTLPVESIYQVKVIPALSDKQVDVTMFSDSEYQLLINGVPIPRAAKCTFPFYKEAYPMALFCTGDYIVSEGTFSDSIGNSSSGITGNSKLYYFNSTDPAIQGSTAKKKIFAILAGKSIDDFMIVLLGSILIQRCDDNTAANEVISVDPDGTVTFKNNQPPKGVYLIIVNI